MEHHNIWSTIPLSNEEVLKVCRSFRLLKPEPRTCLISLASSMHLFVEAEITCCNEKSI